MMATRVTNETIFEELKSQELQRITNHRAIELRLDNIDTLVTGHEKRLDAIDNIFNRVKGGGLAIGALITIALTIVGIASRFA